MKSSKTFYSVKLQGRKRKVRYKGSRRVVYKKLHKLGYSYNKKLKVWSKNVLNIIIPNISIPKKIKQVAIYGFIINDINNYSSIEVSFYTSIDVQLKDVFQIVEKLGYKLIRDGLTDRVDIAERYVDNYNGIIFDNYKQIEDYILEYINTLTFIPRNHSKYRYNKKTFTDLDADKLRKAFFEK